MGDVVITGATLQNAPMANGVVMEMAGNASLTETDILQANTTGAAAILLNSSSSTPNLGMINCTVTNVAAAAGPCVQVQDPYLGTISISTSQLDSATANTIDLTSNGELLSLLDSTIVGGTYSVNCTTAAATITSASGNTDNSSSGVSSTCSGDGDLLN